MGLHIDPFGENKKPKEEEIKQTTQFDDNFGIKNNIPNIQDETEEQPKKVKDLDYVSLDDLMDIMG